MSQKKFFCIIITGIFTFVFFNFFLWHSTTSTLFHAGDLSRLGYYATSAPAIPLSPNYTNKHIEFINYIDENSSDEFDILTIGDSCFNGWGGAYFQDYLTDTYDYKIINAPIINAKNFDHINVLKQLEISGYIKKINPKYIILGIMERSLVASALPENIQIWDLNKPIPAFDTYLSALKNSYRGQTGLLEKNDALFPPHMIKANLGLIDSLLWRKAYPNMVSEDVCIANLNIDAFSNSNQERILLYYHDDLNYVNLHPDYSLLNNKFNLLADHYKQMGIQLIILIITNKSEVYFPYWIDQQNLPENQIFNELSKLPQNYIYFPTKDIMRKAIAEDNAKDLYWVDDTHWSYVAHKYVGDELCKILK